LYSSAEVLYLDDPRDSASKVVIRRTRMLMFKALMSGEVDASYIYRLARDRIPSALRACHSEEQILPQLHRFLITVHSEAMEAGWYSLARDLKNLYTGKKVLLVRFAASLHVRSARSIGSEIQRSAGALSVVTARIRTATMIPPVGVYAEGLNCMYGSRVSASCQKKNYIQFTLARMKGRVNGGDSAAGYSYMPIARMFEGRHVMILGCGYGSGAAVALVSGAIQVSGLDLWDDIQVANSLREDLVPPAVKIVSMESKFVRVGVDPKHRGDATKADIVDLLLPYFGQGTVVVVDIPLRRESDLPNVIANIAELGPAVRTAVRFVGLCEELDVVYLSLLLCYPDCMVIPVCIAAGSAEVWLIFTISRPMPSVGVMLEKPGTWEDHSPGPVDLSILGGGREYLESAIYGPYAGLALADLESGVVEFSELLVESIGDLDHRFTYNQFTEVLHAYCCAAVLGSDAPGALVERSIKEGSITIVLRGKYKSIIVTDSLRRLFTHTVSRLL
jgi:hypothetical protein